MYINIVAPPGVILKHDINAVHPGGNLKLQIVFSIHVGLKMLKIAKDGLKMPVVLLHLAGV